VSLETSALPIKRDGMSMDVNRKPAVANRSRNVEAMMTTFAENVPPVFTNSTVPRHAVESLGTTTLPVCGRERIKPSCPSCRTTALDTIIETPNSSHISRQVGNRSPPASRPSAMDEQ
jgi:hypothetical protein